MVGAGPEGGSRVAPNWRNCAPSSAILLVFCFVLMLALVSVQFRCAAAAGCQGQEVCQEAVCREGTDEEDVSGPIFSRNYEYRVKHLRIDGIKMEHLNF